MKLRQNREMLDNPNFLFMVGRLVGAAEAASLLLTGENSNQAELREVGKRLDKTARWFLEIDRDLPTPAELSEEKTVFDGVN
jgi:hypothetical protein